MHISYVFDCCFSSEVFEEDEYKIYMGRNVAELQDYYPDSSFMVFNFKEGDKRTQISDILSQYDTTIIEFPQQYEGCPMLHMEMIHLFLRSSESWLSLPGQQNVLLMHCERGGWPVLAFMLAALLLFRKQYNGEQKTLEMVYKQAPKELLHLLTPLNPQPSQLRYLQYISRRNLGSDWPPSNTPLALDCIILRFLPSFGEKGCRPVVRIYGQGSSSTDKTSRLIFSSSKSKEEARYYQPEECEPVNIDIFHRVQGDVVLECIHLDHTREEMMFRVMFHPSFVQSNVLLLSRNEVDVKWDLKDQMPNNFNADVLFKDVDALLPSPQCAPPPPPPPKRPPGAGPPPPALGPRAPGTPMGPIPPRGRGLARLAGMPAAAPQRSNLKPLHWSKVTRALQGSLWEELQRPGEPQSAPDFDEDDASPLVQKPKKIHLVDLRRANNTEIMLTKVKMPLPDMMASVLAMDESILDVEQVENLIKFCPNKEEMELLKNYAGDKEMLGKCEQFFLELMKVPRVESKLRVFLFKIQFNTQLTEFKKSLNTVNSACDEVRTSSKFKEIMKRILYLGNTLNQGTARGSAVGFKLDSLLELTDTRASNSQMTLMHYLCKVLAAKSPALLDFHMDLVSLESATKIQLKSLAEEMQAIIKGLEKIKQELTASADDDPVSEVFHATLSAFIGFAESEVGSATNLYSVVGRNADALSLYLGEDPARCPFEQGNILQNNKDRSLGNAINQGSAREPSAYSTYISGISIPADEYVFK
nr:hypothetical protein [Tanacetum cinerariifolium]